MSPTLRSSDPKPCEPETYILNFSYDDDDSCAFTARINDTRFHITVNPKTARSSSGPQTDTHAVYLDRIAALRRGDQQQQQPSDQKYTFESSEGESNFRSNSPHGQDSAVDLDGDAEKEPTQTKVSDEGYDEEEVDNSAETDLQNWILECFADEVARHTSSDRKSSKPHTLEEWYNTPIHYYRVSIEHTGLVPSEIKETESLRKRVDDLQPRCPLPKTHRTPDIPWIHPSTVTVLDTATDPVPIHPTLVEVHHPKTNQSSTQFFKPVDPTQPQPTKREIKHLRDLEQRGAHDQVNVPRLLGLVSNGDSKTECMGLLLTPIPDATPLTKLMDSEVDASKRHKWAKEARRIVKMLHDNGIVWGDAKADNFMVDKDDKLWIIDFGGSYTVGWVDEEIMETEKGDDMGLEKVRNGLMDPDGFTFDPDEEEIGAKDSEPEVGDSSGKRKRRHDETEDELEYEEETPKKRKS